jgi:ABC-2 type transport system ATP-binding protein
MGDEVKCMHSILELDQVSGGYSINKPVLHQLSFSVKPGEMVGLIGLNGAGKSTTMKHILGLMRQQTGTIRINGKTLDEAPEAYRASYVYVPETPLLYEELTVKEHLELTAMAYGLDKQIYLKRSEELLKEFQMKDKLNQFSIHLSKGMRQKMMIMCAFLVQPNIYIIDEPFVGLDPLGIRSLLDLMVRMKQSGASLLISSHILSTIENYCDRFIILHQGKLLTKGELNEIRNASGLGQNATLEEMFYALVKGGS